MTDEMREVIEPRFVKFEEGEVIEGVLLAMQRVVVGGKPTLKYIVDEGSQLCAFLMTYQLSQKIHSSDVGRRIHVTYLGVDPKVSRNGKNMRLFKVLKSTERVTDPDNLGITDEDIPF
jgi:hypothetical protein